MSNHGRREASLSGSSIFVCAIVSEESVVAVLLNVGFARKALSTRPNYTPNSYHVSNSETFLLLIPTPQLLPPLHAFKSSKRN